MMDVRMMRTVFWGRLSDDMYEQSAVFVDPEGNVTVPLAQYKTLMGEAGWKLR